MKTVIKGFLKAEILHFQKPKLFFQMQNKDQPVGTFSRKNVMCRTLFIPLKILDFPEFILSVFPLLRKETPPSSALRPARHNSLNFFHNVYLIAYCGGKKVEIYFSRRENFSILIKSDHTTTFSCSSL